MALFFPSQEEKDGTKLGVKNLLLFCIYIWIIKLLYSKKLLVIESKMRVKCNTCDAMWCDVHTMPVTEWMIRFIPKKCLIKNVVVVLLFRVRYW